MKYKALRIKTKYWRPGENYHKIILENISHEIKQADIVVLSEKALSVAKGRIIDENHVHPSSLSKFLVIVWMRIIWGYILGHLCHLKLKNIERFKTYPLKEGTPHKQLAFRYFGFLQALRHGSEGGMDVSNLPFAYACLPLDDPLDDAKQIYDSIRQSLGKKCGVMIVDTDMCYSWRNLHFTPRQNSIKGIIHKGGFLTYVICRALRFKARATPLAFVNLNLNIDEILRIANLANKKRGSGAGRTAWDMIEKFNVDYTGVTWDMLDEVDHYPVVLIRKADV